MQRAELLSPLCSIDLTMMSTEGKAKDETMKREIQETTSQQPLLHDELEVGDKQFSSPAETIELQHGSWKLCVGDINKSGNDKETGSDDVCWSYSLDGSSSSSSSWCVSSTCFLEVTYRPKEEAMPSYTQRKNVCRRLWNGCCRPSSCCYSELQHHMTGWQKEIYGLDDVITVKYLDEVVLQQDNQSTPHDGIDHTRWKGIQVLLQAHDRHSQDRRGNQVHPFFRGTTADHKYSAVTVPDNYPAENNIATTEHGKSNTVTSNTHPESNSSGMWSGDEEDTGIEMHHSPSTSPLLKSRCLSPLVTDGNGDQSAQKPHHHCNVLPTEEEYHDVIVVTFAIPAEESQTSYFSAPPILWKVDFPIDPDIAIETFTILNGSLRYKEHDSASTGTYPAARGRKRPTHVYINGWQSWSFTGTIPRGEPQPQSAMPNYLSKQFNYGASCPPSVPFATTWKRCWTTNRSTTLSTAQVRNYPPVLFPPTNYKSDMFLAVTSNDRFHTDREDEMLDENNSSCVILGFISQKKQFGLVTMDERLSRVAMHCSCDGMIAHKQLSTSPLAGVATSGLFRSAKDGAAKSAQEIISTDWAWCQILQEDDNDCVLGQQRRSRGPQKEPLAQYIDFVAQYNRARHSLREPLSIGWCSWYHYYENIAEQVLIDSFATLQSLRDKGVGFNMAMCDDGWMPAWGDWHAVKPDKFPSGNDKAMASIAAAMKARGMRPGVWLAPFAADKKSKLVKDHPDWIIRNRAGVPANSANCGKFFYGLDATNPEVREHVRTCIRRAVHQWGFEVLKLDFLYACCLDGNGKYDLSLTRAETMSLALQTLREAAGDNVFIIGCGCPLGPAVGIVDGMRVSADTGPTWNPSFPLPWWDNGTLPCLRAMVRNSLTRTALSHRWWHNDPDCLLLGKSTDLTEEEVVSAATVISMTGGMLLLSDDLTALPPERFDVIAKISPISRAVGRTLDLHCSYGSIPSLLQLWCSDEDDIGINDNALSASIRTGELRNCVHVCSGLGSWTIVSLSNWLEVDAVVSAPFSALLHVPTELSDPDDNGFHVFAFWSSKYVWIPPLNKQAGSRLRQKLSKRLGPHESEIFHVKPLSRHFPQYIGSDLHYTCGYEVESFESERNSATLTLKKDMIRTGKVFIFVPSSTVNDVSATLDAAPAAVEIVSRIPLQSTDSSDLFVGCVIRVRFQVKKLQGRQSSTSGRIVVTF